MSTIKKPLFEILNTLQKDKNHRLWWKHLKDWTDLDWLSFKEL